MAQISATQQPGMQQIDLTSLPIQHLQRLKAQLDQELQVLTDSVHTLKVAQTRFQESGLCLQRITPESKGWKIYSYFCHLLITLNKFCRLQQFIDCFASKE